MLENYWSENSRCCIYNLNIVKCKYSGVHVISAGYNLEKNKIMR